MNRKERRILEQKQQKELQIFKRQAQTATDSAAHRRFGDEFAQRGLHADAARHYMQAQSLGVVDKALLNNLAYVLSHLGRREEAAAAYEAAHALDPADVTILANLGVLYRMLGRFDEALHTYERAAQLDPLHLETAFNRAETLRQIGRGVEAEASYHRCLAIHRESGLAGARNPQHLTLIGKALLKLGLPADALHVFREGLRLKPNDVAILFGLAQAEAKMREFDKAVEHYRTVIALQPNHVGAWKRLGDILLDRKETTAAVQCFKKVLDIDPGNEEARYHLSAATQSNIPASSPADYIRNLFDDYAANFDKHLVENLQYRGPELLWQAVEPLLPSGRQSRIADIGCGTGLCGALFRDVASHLAGVDLSGLMIDKSRVRGVYDELVVGDVTEFLSNREGGFDCVVAADVFIYIGDLEATFGAAARSLVPGGLLAFTTERFDDGDYHLNTTGRYSHNPAYLDHLAATYGFEKLRQEDIVLRLQSGQPVPSFLSVFRRVQTNENGGR